jgi:hypothetical protein
MLAGDTRGQDVHASLPQCTDHQQGAHEMRGRVDELLGVPGNKTPGSFLPGVLYLL